MREIVLDTETTGLKFTDNHRVIEIAAIEIIDFLPTGKLFHKYVTHKEMCLNLQLIYMA